MISLFHVDSIFPEEHDIILEFLDVIPHQCYLETSIVFLS